FVLPRLLHLTFTLRRLPWSTLFPYTTLFRSGVASVAFFADRVRQALTREAHQVLGADTLMTADHAWAPELRDEISRRGLRRAERDRKSTRLNSSHEWISYAVFCLKKKSDRSH